MLFAVLKQISKRTKKLGRKRPQPDRSLKAARSPPQRQPVSRPIRCAARSKSSCGARAKIRRKPQQQARNRSGPRAKSNCWSKMARGRRNAALSASRIGRTIRAGHRPGRRRPRTRISVLRGDRSRRKRRVTLAERAAVREAKRVGHLAEQQSHLGQRIIAEDNNSMSSSRPSSITQWARWQAAMRPEPAAIAAGRNAGRTNRRHAGQPRRRAASHNTQRDLRRPSDRW